MIRKYGKEPFIGAVIHGGPGDCGSVACVAKELSKSFGIIEPIQSKMTIPELIDELYEQMSSVSSKPMTLIGHSWGAWLIILFATKYPKLVNQLVCVGSGPFKKEYVSQIMQRRLSRLSAAEARLYQELLVSLSTASEHDDAIKKLGGLVEKTDNYDVFEIEASEHALHGGMYASIWPQADEMRRNGSLVNALKTIQCPVIVIHGEDDPHPVEGVVEPLREQGVVFETHLFPKCGHSPFKEKFAFEVFYQILREAFLRTSSF